MTNLQDAPSEYIDRQSQRTGIKLMIALGIVIGVIILLLGFGGAALMYLDAQREIEIAGIAREKAEEEKRTLQTIQAEAERKVKADRLAREEADRKADEERLAREAEARKPNGRVVSVDSEGAWEFVNGEMDAGFKVTTVIKNNGPAGDVKVVAFLSCSQGEWIRTQPLFFRAGESMTLRYFFHEPTISVTGCQARAAVSP